jgi:predicted lipoprotein with Yx(FWY)xxD motif
MSVVRPRAVLVAALVAAFAALLVATASARSQTVASRGALVSVAKTPLGKVLVDAKGRVLYLYTPDHRNTSVCYGKCASFWPPLLTSGKPRAAKGAKAPLLGATMRKDGKHQVTYAGHPLYLFAGDKKAGDENGQGFQKIWWVVSTAGKKITKAVPASPALPATLQLGTTSLGQIITDTNGRTVYTYKPDSTTTSTCYGQCAANWPPVLVTGASVAGKGLDASLLGTTTRTDGTVQVTYAGHPLYLFVGDSKSGDVNGEGKLSIWYAISASGSQM